MCTFKVSKKPNVLNLLFKLTKWEFSSGKAKKNQAKRVHLLLKGEQQHGGGGGLGRRRS